MRLSTILLLFHVVGLSLCQGPICDLKIEGECFFAEFADRVTYDIAEELCEGNNAHPAFVKNEGTYNQMVDYLRKNMPEGWNLIGVWTGIHINPRTRLITPADSYLDGIRKRRGSTNVYIQLNRDPYAYYFFQGMVHSRADFKLSGVLCQTNP